jgi:nucleoside-triphosphatase
LENYLVNPPKLDIKPIILLTGKPGVGKSTVVKRIIDNISEKVGGFYTREVRENSIRLGFEIVTLSGEVARLAVKSPKPMFSNEATFGHYKVNLDALITIGIPALQNAASMGQIVIIDEIGPMELLSEEFRETVDEILNNNTLLVVGTIVERSYEFSDAVKANPRVILKYVTTENRKKLPSEILDILSG